MEVIKYFKVNDKNMIHQNVWNAANMGLRGKFMERNNQNQISKHPIKNLEKQLIKPQ